MKRWRQNLQRGVWTSQSAPAGQTSLSGTMLPNPHRSLFWFLLGSWACSCFAASFPFFEPVRPPRPCQVMVHRGEAGQAPENTRLALLRCIEDGLEWAEVDLRLTQDGQHILWHDPAVLDINGKAWKIAEHSWAELIQLDVGSTFAARFKGVSLLSLQECFAFCKGRLNLYLDCKAINP